jgi:uncharacterized protein with PQ loop repeat
VTWIAIGITNHITPTIVVNVFCCIGALAVLYALVSQDSLAPVWPLVVAVVAAGINITLFLAFGRTVVSALGVGLAVSMFIPQAMKVRRQSALGVSIPTWLLALATSSLWILYGVAIDQPVLIAPNLVMIPAALAIVSRTLAERRMQTVASGHSQGTDLHVGTTSY